MNYGQEGTVSGVALKEQGTAAAVSPEGFAGSVRYVKAPERSSISDTADVSELVTAILCAVQTRGDAAVREYSIRFDKAELDHFEVSGAERQSAVDVMDPQTRADTEFAIENVRRFAEAQLGTILPLEIEALPGLHLGHRVIPIERVGAYVPGGRFPLLSAPIMTIVPGKVAGCDEIVACLPPNAHAAMIAGCHLSGADRIFRIGGAQAIAAMAYGTESVPQVNKIVGPGNAFVNEAKRQVFGPVGIDQLAGPSEIFVVADASGDPELIATDLLAQAEHDVRTRVGLITTDEALAEATAREVLRQLETLGTAKIAAESWANYGEITVCEDEGAMIRYSDHVAAEHLEVHTADPHAFARKLRNYGSLFIGENASVVYSDKCVGTNHTLPTMNAGRYTGGLWVGSYLKIATHQWLEDSAISIVAPPAMRQSGSEGLDGHQKAAAIRYNRQAAIPASDAFAPGAGPAMGKVLQVERRDFTELVPVDRPRVQSMRGFDPIYTDIVDYIVRCTHKIWDERDVGLIYTHYTHNCVLYGVLGTMYDRESIVRETIQRIVELPDRRGMATSVIWRGNDVDGFYTSHMTHGVGRHTEYGIFGKPTGRTFVTRTIVDCMILENKIYREWVARDNMAQLVQLGIDPQAYASAIAQRKFETGEAVVEIAENRRLLGQYPPETEPDLSLAHTDLEAEVLRWLHHIYNKRMFGRIGEIYASNCQWHGPLMRELYGVGAVMQQTMRLVAMIPDCAFVPQHICSVPSEEGGTKVAIRWVLDGHHLGYGSLGAPTGHKLVVMGFTHLHIRDGKIVDEWVLYDELSMLVQLKLGALTRAS